MLFSIKFWTTFYYFIFFAVIRRVIIINRQRHFYFCRFLVWMVTFGSLTLGLEKNGFFTKYYQFFWPRLYNLKQYPMVVSTCLIEGVSFAFEYNSFIHSLCLYHESLNFSKLLYIWSEFRGYQWQIIFWIWLLNHIAMNCETYQKILTNGTHVKKIPLLSEINNSLHYQIISQFMTTQSPTRHRRVW